MSTAALKYQAPLTGSWRLWASQLWAILRIEVRRALWMRRGMWIYVIAFGPALVIGVHALNSPLGRYCNINEDTGVLAQIFQLFYLRIAIFFGCMGLFTWLFRGDVIEKSLHYYLLSPVRREIFIVGKFLSGVAASCIIFGLGVLVSFTFMYSHFGPAGRDFVFHGPGLGQLVSYLAVTILACLGYGSIFLALSLVVKNPILPGVVVLLWETFHAVLPSLLQKFSVMFYLKQLCPVRILPSGMTALFSVVAEPVSPWVALPGLLILCMLILAFACMRIRRTEVSYLAD